MSGVEVRQRRPEDIQGLAGVLVRVHGVDGYPVEGVDDPEGWLTDRGEIVSWTAVVDGRPVGQVMLLRPAGPDDEIAAVWAKATGGDLARLVVLARLFVDPEARGLGAGQRLLDAAHGYAAERGLAVALDVMVKDRAAIRLYERLGYRRVGTVNHRHDGGVEPAVVYALNHPTGT